MSKTERIEAAGLSEHRGAEPVHEGDHVAWKWGGGMVSHSTCPKLSRKMCLQWANYYSSCCFITGMAEGHVAEVSDHKLTRETKPGVEITRNGEPDNPALYIERDGNNVVKKQSEVYKMHDE
jgi:Hypervirulence associated proteins TUDOR domain